MSQAIGGATAHAPAAARRKGSKADLDRLRDRMRGLGFGYDEIAAEVSRRYQMRPRKAYRLAWGWTQDQAAARFNERAASEGTDPEGRAGMTGPHLCELEQWPDSERRPSVYALCLLAMVYDTDVLCLLDLADHESLPQQDRLVLMRRLPGQTTFGERVLALQQDARQPASEGQPVSTEGMTLTLPFVPARLVIEVSGPAGKSGLLAGSSDDLETAPGRLALVRDTALRTARGEAAGR